jgi:hypothetical protein
MLHAFYAGGYSSRAKVLSQDWMAYHFNNNKNVPAQLAHGDGVDSDETVDLMRWALGFGRNQGTPKSQLYDDLLTKMTPVMLQVRVKTDQKEQKHMIVLCGARMVEGSGGDQKMIYHIADPAAPTGDLLQWNTIGNMYGDQVAVEVLAAYWVSPALAEHVDLESDDPRIHEESEPDGQKDGIVDFDEEVRLPESFGLDKTQDDGSDKKREIWDYYNPNN